ncbi:hypothetical protein [Austwickia sp. TVS 96-490-7B]|uniref:hypothetical protein n=1 Tax=Austwickia sp. TVS 96-490-7B TaxID=2830843 RepID=UPI001C5A06BF|nr:hypothetical protein [Austwickia sp. TVS 96-490-7B]
MSPSSVILVVVLLIWAAYWLLDVLRRKDHSSASRSVDRFSAQMRVLERRSVSSVPRSVLHSSSGATRTSLLAAGAMNGEQGQAYAAAPTPAAAATRPQNATVEAADIGASDELNEIVHGHSHQDHQTPYGHHTDTITTETPTTAVPGAAPSDPARRRVITLSRARGVTLLGFAGASLATALAAVLGNAPWNVPLSCAVITVALFTWVRQDRLAAQTRRAQQQRMAAARLRVEAARTASHPSVTTAPMTQWRPQPRTAPTARPRTVPREQVPFDVAAYDAPPRQSESGLSPSDPADVTVPVPVGVGADDPLVREDSWQPAPVPRPTYAVKARAAHSDLPVPVPIDIEDDPSEDFLPPPARAVGS